MKQPKPGDTHTCNYCGGFCHLINVTEVDEGEAWGSHYRDQRTFEGSICCGESAEPIPEPNEEEPL